jgi:mannose-6-phosphate isomerase-like protein (cupin superfamily)
MFEILFKVQIKPERLQEFLNFIQWDIEVARKWEKDGTLQFSLYPDPSAANSFVVYEAYRDEQAFEAHKQNEPYKRWEREIKPNMVVQGSFHELRATHSLSHKIETKQLPASADYLAPDGSEIRLLPSMRGGGMCHCTLPPGKVSSAVKHQTVEEIWYFIEGHGQVWRKLGEQESETDVCAGVSLTIPVSTHFQFRNPGPEPLRFLIATMLPWPGPEEAVPVQNHWSNT